ncbi:unnamed protein product [Cunninghamella echinulata]
MSSSLSTNNNNNDNDSERGDNKYMYDNEHENRNNKYSKKNDENDNINQNLKKSNTTNNKKNTNHDRDDDDDDDDDDDTSDSDYVASDIDISDDELVAAEEEGMLPDEIQFLRSDQNIPIQANQHNIPTLYYPTFKDYVINYVKKHSILFIRGITIFIMITAFIFKIYYIKKKVSMNGYCDSLPTTETASLSSSSSSSEIISVIKSNWVHKCIPCPTNGICQHGQLTCKPLYRPYRSFNNKFLNQFWPVGEECRKDLVKANYIKKIEKSIHQHLMIRQGKRQCYEAYHFFSPTSCQSFKYTLPMEKTNIKNIKQYLKGIYQLKNINVDEIINIAIQHTMNHPNIFTTTIDNELYLSTDRAKFDSSCSFWITYCTLPRTARLLLYCIPSLIIIYYLLYKKYSNYKLQQSNIDNMVNNILHHLRQQKKDYILKNNNEAGCSIYTLRNEVGIMRDQSIEIWKEALRNVKKNSSIRVSTRIAQGEPVEYLEWI